MWETVADAVTRRGAQRLPAEAGGWWVWSTFRWMSLHAKRGGGYQVLHIGVTATNDC